jgi:hypothetical protein
MPSFASTIVLSVPLYIGVFAIVLSALAAPPVRAQDDLTQRKAQNDGFFSGNVVEVTGEQVVVSRTILGKPPEKRTFKILATTKVEGKMKQKSRVTVRYAAADEGAVALSIIVRADKPDNNNKKK